MNLSGISREECRAFVGNGAKVLMKKALESAKPGASENIHRAMEIYAEIFDEYCTHEIRVYPGVLEVLEEMKKQGIQMAVLTNKPDPQAKKVTNFLFEEGTFFHVWGQTKEMKRKPHPEGVFRLMAEAGVERKNCLFVGDSEVDFETGEAAEVDVLVGTWGFRSRKELEESGVTNLIERPEDILDSIL